MMTARPQYEARARHYIFFIFFFFFFMAMAYFLLCDDPTAGVDLKLCGLRLDPLGPRPLADDDGATRRRRPQPQNRK
jgi:hypothetical protein